MSQKKINTCRRIVFLCSTSHVIYIKAQLQDLGYFCMMIRSAVLSAWTTLPPFAVEIPIAVQEFGFFFLSDTPVLDCVPADKVLISLFKHMLIFHYSLDINTHKPTACCGWFVGSGGKFSFSVFNQMW